MPEPSSTCPLCGGHVEQYPDIAFIEGIFYYKGARIVLTQGEYRLLSALAKRRGTPVSREALWVLEYGHLPNDSPSPKIFDVIMCKLRWKLARQGVPFAIETIWGRGWRLRTVEEGFETKTANQIK